MISLLSDHIQPMPPSSRPEIPDSSPPSKVTVSHLGCYAGAIQTIASMLDKTWMRCAALTMLGKTIEHAHQQVCAVPYCA